MPPKHERVSRQRTARKRGILGAVPGNQKGIDGINRRLLGELQQDARLTVAELGRRVGLSSPAVAERLQRLESDGVIRGYHAQVDPKALGYTLTAVIRIRPAPREIKKVA